jgi:hypothetical protein
MWFFAGARAYCGQQTQPVRNSRRHSAGLRFNLANRENASLSVGNALMWEREGLDLDVGDPHMDETSVLRSSSYINLHYDKRVLISMTSYAQFAVDDPGDLRLLGIAQLTRGRLARSKSSKIVAAWRLEDSKLELGDDGEQVVEDVSLH